MICPFCNQSLPEGALFCGYCGNKLTGEPRQDTDVTTEAAVSENTAQNPDSTVSAANEAPGSAVSVAVTEAPEAEATSEAPGSAVSAAVTAAPEAEATSEAPGSAVSAVAAAAPEADVTSEAPGSAVSAAVTAAPEAAETARSSSVNVLPDMPDSVRNGSAVNLGKNENKPKSENKAKGVFRNIAAAVKNDTRNAAQAVKTRSFKELLGNKTVLILCALVIAIILIVIIACCAAVSGSKLEIKGSYYSARDGGDAVFLYNGAVVKGTDFSSGASVIASSLDGTTALVKDGEELYILKVGKASLITDEFDNSQASISANGKTAAYASDDAVYVYTGGKPRKIADVEDDNYCVPVVSPDGKVVAFSDLDDDDINTYAWNGSKVIDLDADIVPFSVSNGGKMIYGADLSGDLCYIRNLRKDADEKIDSISDIAGISLDHTKLLYISEDSTYCFDTALDDEDGVRITRDVIAPITNFTYMGSTPYIESFNKFYGRENGNLYEYFRKGKSYDDEKLVSDVYGLIVSEDGKSFVYIDDGDVMRGALSNAKNAGKVGKDAVSIRGNDTLSSVFYLDDENNLRYAGKDGKIASDVEKYLVTDGGVCVFSDDDGELWYSVRGGAKKKAGLDEIGALIIRNDVIYVMSDGELYTSTNGKSFKKTGVEVG